jgi:uncharacterized protein (DUF1330 family)
MAIAPTAEQLAALLERAPQGSLHMLNLLKFRRHAEYQDGRDSGLSGAQAYALYGRAVTELISAMGGRITWAGFPNVLVIGDGVEPEWDQVAIVSYPSIDEFRAMIDSDAYQAAHVHREAGLERQLLINCLDPTQLSAAG